MSKVRLVGGPFGGKVMNFDGGAMLIMRGPKKMSRKARYEWMRDNQQSFYSSRAPGPIVEAKYELCTGPFGNHTTVVMAPLRHPDGSLFYKYIEGTKREWSNNYV